MLAVVTVLDMTMARAYAESLMSSTCTIRARSGGGTTDPNTGQVTDTPGAVVYSGKCRVRPAATAQSEVTAAGGAEVFRFDYLVSVPFAEAAVLEGHLVTIDTSPDPALVDVRVEVRKVERGDHLTARRLFCTDTA